MMSLKTDHEPGGRLYLHKIPEGNFVWDDPDKSLHAGTLYRMLYDGAFAGWGKLYDVSAEPYCGFEPGDRVLVYPGPRMSARMEALRDSIEDFEKIRVLKETGAFTESMSVALKEIDARAVLRDSASKTAEKVNHIETLLNE